MSNTAAIETNPSSKSNFNFISGFQRIRETPPARGQKESRIAFVDEYENRDGPYQISSLAAKEALLGGFNIEARLSGVFTDGPESWDYKYVTINRPVGRLTTEETRKLLDAFNNREAVLPVVIADEKRLIPTKQEMIAALENL